MKNLEPAKEGTFRKTRDKLGKEHAMEVAATAAMVEASRGSLAASGGAADSNSATLIAII